MLLLLLLLLLLLSRFSCVRLCDPIDGSPPGSSVHSGENTVVGCHSLLCGVFPTQGLNLVLLHCRQILYYLSHQGSPYLIGNYKILHAA